MHKFSKSPALTLFYKGSSVTLEWKLILLQSTKQLVPNAQVLFKCRSTLKFYFVQRAQSSEVFDQWMRSASTEWLMSRGSEQSKQKLLRVLLRRRHVCRLTPIFLKISLRLLIDYKTRSWKFRKVQSRARAAMREMLRATVEETLSKLSFHKYKSVGV